MPWQIKSIFIIVLFLLDLPRNALFCKRFRGFVKCVFWLASWQNRARWSKLLRAVSSKIGSKTEWITTKRFDNFILYFIAKDKFFQFFWNGKSDTYQFYCSEMHHSPYSNSHCNKYIHSLICNFFFHKHIF